MKLVLPCALMLLLITVPLDVARGASTNSNWMITGDYYSIVDAKYMQDADGLLILAKRDPCEYPECQDEDWLQEYGEFFVMYKDPTSTDILTSIHGWRIGECQDGSSIGQILIATGSFAIDVKADRFRGQCDLYVEDQLIAEIPSGSGYTIWFNSSGDFEWVDIHQPGEEYSRKIILFDHIYKLTCDRKLVFENDTITEANCFKYVVKESLDGTEVWNTTLLDGRPTFIDIIDSAIGYDEETSFITVLSHVDNSFIHDNVSFTGGSGKGVFMVSTLSGSIVNGSDLNGTLSKSTFDQNTISFGLKKSISLDTNHSSMGFLSVPDWLNEIDTVESFIGGFAMFSSSQNTIYILDHDGTKFRGPIGYSTMDPNRIWISNSIILIASEPNLINGQPGSPHSFNRLEMVRLPIDDSDGDLKLDFFDDCPKDFTSLSDDSSQMNCNQNSFHGQEWNMLGPDLTVIQRTLDVTFEPSFLDEFQYENLNFTSDTIEEQNSEESNSPSNGNEFDSNQPSLNSNFVILAGVFIFLAAFIASFRWRKAWK